MIISLSVSKEISSLLTSNNKLISCRPQQDKVVVVLGTTGVGKSRLSIDIATRFLGEVINSDKIQVYRNLDITTNKITHEERRGVPHHLMDIIDPNMDFSASDFRTLASLSLKLIHNRQKLPIIVGGSNSFIEALVDDHFRTKYECCLLWVDVAMPILHSSISARVDKMVERGMVDEVRDFYIPNADYFKGIRRAIGVPELDMFLRVGSLYDEETRSRILAKAIDQIKTNTSKLACRQLEKIHRLNETKGWRIHRLDATDVHRKCGGEALDAWKDLVEEPGADIVRTFLLDSTVTMA